MVCGSSKNYSFLANWGGFPFPSLLVRFQWKQVRKRGRWKGGELSSLNSSSVYYSVWDNLKNPPSWTLKNSLKLVFNLERGEGNLLWTCGNDRGPWPWFHMSPHPLPPSTVFFLFLSFGFLGGRFSFPGLLTRWDSRQFPGDGIAEIAFQSSVNNIAYA